MRPVPDRQIDTVLLLPSNEDPLKLCSTRMEVGIGAIIGGRQPPLMEQCTCGTWGCSAEGHLGQIGRVRPRQKGLVVWYDGRLCEMGWDHLMRHTQGVLLSRPTNPRLPVVFATCGLIIGAMAREIVALEAAGTVLRQVDVPLTAPVAS